MTFKELKRFERGSKGKTLSLLSISLSLLLLSVSQQS